MTLTCFTKSSHDKIVCCQVAGNFIESTIKYKSHCYIKIWCRVGLINAKLPVSMSVKGLLLGMVNTVDTNAACLPRELMLSIWSLFIITLSIINSIIDLVNYYYVYLYWGSLAMWTEWAIISAIESLLSRYLFQGSGFNNYPHS